ncbi:MAG TPA: peptidoglycan editing factor PgeF [Polyangiaceae bacterium]|nr:peptidoglycan editing factor PgeF [Polyangiaceae bacterium]
MTADYLESSLLRAAGFRHAFFTRRGGVSQGPYASLNFSLSVGDAAEHVARNFELAGDVVGVVPAGIFFLSQVHGAAVEVLTDAAAHQPDARASVIQREGDALLSSAPGVACSVRTADCVPILIGERRSGAVAAIHAGWRGLVRGVIEAGTLRLRELAQGAPGSAELVAAIGPHIGPESFEVGEDVAAELEGVSEAKGVVQVRGGRRYVALNRIVRAKLQALGIAPAQIDEVGGCTLSEPDRFFSFRRDGKESGRHLSVVVARPPG